MPLDSVQPKVTISMAGLLLIDIGEVSHCQVDVIPCDDHQFTIDVQKIAMDPEGKTPISSQLIRQRLEKIDLLQIGLRGTKRSGGFQVYSSWDAPPTFNRLASYQDTRDHRWMLDLGEDPFGTQKIVKKSPPESPRAAAKRSIKKSIGITDGELYTEQITDEHYASYRLNETNYTLVGRLAYRMAIDIPLVPGTEVAFTNREGPAHPELILPYEPHTRYLVTMDNLCYPSGAASDFIHYFDSLTTDKGLRYDLIRVVNNRNWPGPGITVEGREDLSLDSAGQICFVLGTGKR